MPRYVLHISAKIKNVEILEPEEEENMNYFFKLKCEYCGWTSEREVCISMGAKVQSGRQTVNLSTKCQGCDREGSISLVPGYGQPLTRTAHKNIPVMAFDCNGFRPKAYSFNGGWKVESTDGAEMLINLVDGSYEGVTEFGETVKIGGLESDFIVLW